jgi:hypothetical protein
MEKEQNFEQKTNLDKLVNDLPLLKAFWNKTIKDKENGWVSAHNNYKDLKTGFREKLKKLEKDGGEINPAQLKVELQFNTWPTNNWITITKIDCPKS